MDAGPAIGFDELTQLMREQMRWVRALAAPVVREELRNALATAEKYRVYRMLDGTHTYRQIGDVVGVGIGTISSWVNKWAALGLVVVEGQERCRLIDPVDLELAEPKARQGGKD